MSNRNRNINGKGAQIIVAFLIFLAVFGVGMGIFFPQALGISIKPVFNFVNIPTVDTTLVSSTDGAVHNVKTTFSIELDKSVKDINESAIKQQITEIMSNLEYSKITEQDSIDYIKDNVRAKLLETISEDKLKGIYITGIQSGESLLYSEPTPTESNREKAFKGLFPNMK